MENFSVNGRIRSIRFALEGILLLLKGEPNARIHFAATSLVVFAGLAFDISAAQWTVVILAITIVWGAEAINTAFELLCNVTNPEFHPVVKQAKDVSAGAVLLSSLGALVVGLIVFIPYFVSLFEN